jgi:hypothetical protein
MAAPVTREVPPSARERAPVVVRHPLFARMYDRLSRTAEETEQADHRRDLLAGLTGRVIEVGAGNGLNFRYYPTSADEVVAVEPEAFLRERAEEAATVRPGRLRRPRTGARRARLRQPPAGRVLGRRNRRRRRPPAAVRRFLSSPARVDPGHPHAARLRATDRPGRGQTAGRCRAAPVRAAPVRALRGRRRGRRPGRRHHDARADRAADAVPLLPARASLRAEHRCCRARRPSRCRHTHALLGHDAQIVGEERRLVE